MIIGTYNFQEGNITRAGIGALALNGSTQWLWPYTVVQTGPSPGITVDPTILIGGDGTIYYTIYQSYQGLGTHAGSLLFALNPNGTFQWAYGDSFIGTPALGGGMIVFGSSSGLTALDLDGHVKWKADVQNILGQPAIGNDGTVYIGTTDSLVAIGANPIVLEVGLLILVPVIVACLLILWGSGRVRHLD